MVDYLNKVEIGGGSVAEKEDVYHLSIPSNAIGYADAQLDDYGHLSSRRDFPHQPPRHDIQGRTPVKVVLEAKFSHGEGELKGTAGFGFWNAPIGEVRQRLPTFPQAVWFFYASEPNRLPFLKGQTGWFASVWGVPTLRNQNSFHGYLGIQCAHITFSMTAWHSYRIEWFREGCLLCVDDHEILRSSISPFTRLGFVAWIDNQFMALPKMGYVKSDKGEQGLFLSGLKGL